MKHILTITKKELLSYFNSPASYIFIVVFLVFSGWLFFSFGNFFAFNDASMRYFFSLMPWVFLFIIPAATMRLWAEEQKSGTIEVLLTLPVKDFEVVLGKFFASFIFIFISLALTFPIPILITYLGDPDFGVIIASYIGTLFLGGSYIAIGLFASSLTRNQIVAFIIALSLSFLLFIIGHQIVLVSLPESLVPVFRFIGLGSHFESITRGVLDSRDILYYLSVIFLFLYFNMKRIEGRKYS